MADMGVDEATEIVLQAFLAGLEGADDEDTIRPGLMIRLIAEAMNQDPDRADEVAGITVAQMRDRIRGAMGRIAHGNGPSADAPVSPSPKAS